MTMLPYVMLMLSGMAYMLSDDVKKLSRISMFKANLNCKSG